MDKASRHHYRERLKRFRELMPRRVQRVLLVASPYDSFILEEEGQLEELILTELADVDLLHAPGMRQVSTGTEALRAVSEASFDLVITTGNLGDMSLTKFSEKVKDLSPQLPVVLLAFDLRQVTQWHERPPGVDSVFVWQGDFRILMAIVKLYEDRWNIDSDVEKGISVILLVEDSIHYYSSFLPAIYTMLMQQSQRVIVEGLNLSHKVTRMRARPKILLSGSYETAWEYYLKYKDHMIGLLTDVTFPWEGHEPVQAGIALARAVKQESPDLPILIQTQNPEYIGKANTIGVKSLLKNSPTLIHELTDFMLDNFGFGDFIFKDENEKEWGRARDLRDMEEVLLKVPLHSVLFHARRNHFSTWFKARTEFSLAEIMRSAAVSDFGEDAKAVRDFLIRSIREFRGERQAARISSFSRDELDFEDRFTKIGSGSIGGKARGLAFLRQLIYDFGLRRQIPGVRIMVPSAVVLTTEVFDAFLHQGGLREFALKEEDDAVIRDRFLRARFPRNALSKVKKFLEIAHYPLAVRSSSLLEDSQYQPFAGIYETYMVANREEDPGARLRSLLQAIKLVYASTFAQKTKAYIRNTPYRLEEEKMAVILQRVVGRERNGKFYPTISGVAQSHNFYPNPPMRPQDGLAAVALGLGEQVMGGGMALRFSPRHPQSLPQFSSPDKILKCSQRHFLALDLTGAKKDTQVKEYSLAEALQDGTLDHLASVYSPDNNAVYDGLGREGAPIVTFAPILKYERFPLARVLRSLLAAGHSGLNAPVLLEFAVDFGQNIKEVHNFACLQLRPLILHQEGKPVTVSVGDKQNALCWSDHVMGNGVVETIKDIVVVSKDRFDRAKSRQVAEEVSYFNSILSQAERPYLLIGVGRWGASDPWLGIPVSWEQIAGARVIVESGFREFAVEPSQGSHFFQNLVSTSVGYFSVGMGEIEGGIDWDWLESKDPHQSREFTRWIQLDGPLEVHMAGQRRAGVILKPSAGTNAS